MILLKPLASCIYQVLPLSKDIVLNPLIAFQVLTLEANEVK